MQRPSGAHDVVSSARFIFVLGVCQRVGTHYVESLLLGHPDCEPGGPRPIDTNLDFEDKLLVCADHLSDYVADTLRTLSRPYDEDEVLRNRLLAGLGTGLLQTWTELCAHRENTRLIMRSPSCRNLHLLPLLFPESQCILIVRDPRAVADSGVKSFGSPSRGLDQPWEQWVRQWRQGVRDFLNAHSSPLQVQGFRFEDLVTRRAEMMASMLQFLKLDPARYDFEEDIPLRGSSRTTQERGHVHWVPREKGEYDPAAPPEWPEKKLRQLGALAGPEMRMMGYGLDVEPRLRENVRQSGMELSTRGIQLLRRQLGRRG